MHITDPQTEIESPARRNFLRTAAGAGFLVATGAGALLLPTEQAAARPTTQPRKLITAGEFLERVEAARDKDDEKAFYAVQQNYMIYGKMLQFPIRIHKGDGSILRTANINFNPDNLVRFPAPEGQNFPVTALPTIAYLNPLHTDIYTKSSAQDTMPPKDEDAINFEYRKKEEKEAADKARARNRGETYKPKNNRPDTWDSLIDHLSDSVSRSGHGLAKDDIFKALAGGMAAIHTVPLHRKDLSFNIDDQRHLETPGIGG